MERPHHLHTANQSNSSKVTGLVIVIVIHVLAIAGLITALASGQIMKQLQDIQATVDSKTPPKEPPPPPPDLAAPPPPTAVIPEFSVAAEAPPPIRTVPPPPPQAAAPPRPPAPTKLEPIMRTHSIPPYPTISQRLGEHGTTVLQVTISAEGNVTDAKVNTSSGSERLDQAAIEYVKARWKWKPPTDNGQAVTAQTLVRVVWDLKDAQ